MMIMLLVVQFLVGLRSPRVAEYRVEVQDYDTFGNGKEKKMWMNVKFVALNTPPSQRLRHDKLMRPDKQ